MQTLTNLKNFFLPTDHSPLSTQSEQGYIALISTIIVTLVLLGLTFTISAAGFFARFDSLSGEYKRVSLGLAESCANTALLRIGQNPDYAGGQTISVGPDNCEITTVTYNPSSGYDANNKKVATISTKASYLGAFSNMVISATVQNPSVVQIPPTLLTISASVPPSANLADFQLAYNGTPATSGAVNTVTPDSYTITATAPAGFQPSPWAGDCNSGGSVSLAVGESKLCYIIFSEIPDTAQLTLVANITPAGPTSTLQIKNNSTNEVTNVTSGQPLPVPKDTAYTAIASTPSGYLASPWSGACNETTGVTPILTGPNNICAINFTLPNTSCAETVMMLDRTGSMDPDGSANYLPNERAAAKAILNLYGVLNPCPKVGVGAFGDSDASIVANASGTPIGRMTNVYGDDDGPQQTSTGFKSPTASVQNGSNDSWSNPGNAFTDSNGAATNNTGARHRYYNFGFVIPNDATITGIEVKADAWSATGAGSLPTDNFGTGSTDTDVPNWNENGGSGTPGSGTEARAATNGNDSPSSDGGRFAAIYGNGGWICRNINAAGYSALQLSYLWRGDQDANSNSDDGIVEYKTNGNCTDNNGWSQLQNHDLQNDNAWSSQTAFALPSSLNNNSFNLRFRAGSNNTNEYFRVDAVVLTGTSSSTGCRLDIGLSDNGGSSWSDDKEQVLTGTETTYTYGGSNDLWGENWSVTDFSNANFRVRVQDADPGSSCLDSATTNLDWLQANIHYTSVDNDLYTAIDIATSSASGGTDIAKAIAVGRAELNDPSRHTSGKEKVLIILSDGDPSVSNGLANAITAANNAKSTNTAYNPDGKPVQIFTIFFGTDPDGTGPQGQELLAQIASASTLPTVNIVTNGAKRSGGTATITTSTPHKLSVNQKVNIAGVSVSAFNGSFRITSIPTPTTFTFALSGSSSTSTGGTVTPTNLFVAPDASQMSAVFTAIGIQVCPAAASASQASMQITTTVVNKSGGQAMGSDFHITISGAAASPNSFDGSSPTTTVVTPGANFGITVTGPDQPPGGTYFSPQFIGCSGSSNSVSAGQTAYCSIVIYDTPAPPAPPPPPPPPAPIDIGSWVEHP